MSNVSVSVKVLSGDTLSLEVVPTITRRQFYTRVFMELTDEVVPEEVVPEEEYQITLMREEEELRGDDEPLNPSEGEMFFLFVDHTRYAFVLDQHIIDAFEVTREEVRTFEAMAYEIRTMTETGRHPHIGQFYHCREKNGWYRGEGVKCGWVGREDYDMRIRVPEDAVAYATMEEMARAAMEHVPDLSKRVRAYLVEEWVHQWRELWEGEGEEDAELWYEEQAEEGEWL